VNLQPPRPGHPFTRGKSLPKQFILLGKRFYWLGKKPIVAWEEKFGRFPSEFFLLGRNSVVYDFASREGATPRS
jgi:hypothetical protein